jgi:dephospho-CoA kinase
MKVIGLTGGIGSGKSTVARVFNTLGVPVFDADSEAKKLYAEDPTLLPEVVKIFGPQILNDDSSLNREALAGIVFSDAESLTKLNALVHPRVGKRFQEWKEKQQCTAVIREAAILFESGSHTDCDEVVVVTAPENLRIERVMKRNAIAADEVRARIARQWTGEQLLQQANAVIQNDEKTLVLPQVLAIAEKWQMLPIREK